jgi:glyoxylase-like metal-dependent hydrolase (beta-lactamase superfamily II)
MLARAARLSRSLETFRLDVLGRAPSTSLLLSGVADAILVNAQFLRDDAAQLAHTIAASGKRLTTIYISAADPQAYFGLGVLQQAFPQALILASGATVEAIGRQAGARIAYWGGILKHNAPRCIVMPQPYEGSSLQLEGRHVELRQLEAALA